MKQLVPREEKGVEDWAAENALRAKKRKCVGRRVRGVSHRREQKGTVTRSAIR